MDIIIQQVRSLCKDESMVLTQHATLRCRMRDILLDDIQVAIQNGDIIESYPDDFPHPSVLISGKDLKHEPLHIVVGMSESMLWIITAYFPDSAKWEADYKTRKAAAQ